MLAMATEFLAGPGHGVAHRVSGPMPAEAWVRSVEDLLAQEPNSRG
jgi:hypothetical protein